MKHVNEILNDQNLRPYFLDLISKNLVLALTKVHRVKYVDLMRYQKDYYESLMKLSQVLSEVVTDVEISSLIQEVTMHYLSSIGTIGIQFDE